LKVTLPTLFVVHSGMLFQVMFSVLCCLFPNSAETGRGHLAESQGSDLGRWSNNIFYLFIYYYFAQFSIMYFKPATLVNKLKGNAALLYNFFKYVLDFEL
jgi:hypothetical protein